MPSLKSLDRGQRVLYAGSFSKVLFPTLRLGYLVVPHELHDVFLRAARLLTLSQPVLEQKVVATFMRKGYFVRHIRRMRILYAERRRHLAAALEAGLKGRVKVELASGGMHLPTRFSGMPDDMLLANRAEHGDLAPTALSSLAVAHDVGQGLLLSFTNIVAAKADLLVGRLAELVD